MWRKSWAAVLWAATNLLEGAVCEGGLGDRHSHNNQRIPDGRHSYGRRETPFAKAVEQDKQTRQNVQAEIEGRALSACIQYRIWIPSAGGW